MSGKSRTSEPNAQPATTRDLSRKSAIFQRIRSLTAMDRIFTAWAKDGCSTPTCVVEGEGPPRFNNGNIDPDCQVLLWRIEVGSFEEVMAIRNLRAGLEPYKPQGNSVPCPNCGARHYPEGSEECWKCSHKCWLNAGFRSVPPRCSAKNFVSHVPLARCAPYGDLGVRIVTLPSYPATSK